MSLWRRPERPGFVIGETDRGELLMLRDEPSMVLTAPPGSGKSVSGAIPNALLWPESMVANDIKGELFDLTSAYRAAHGQSVFRFAPFDPEGVSHRWNPLEDLPEDPRRRAAEVVSMAFALYPDSARDVADIWQPTARNLFIGLALYVLETPSLPSTFGEVLRQGSGKGESLRDHVQSIVHARNYRERVVGKDEAGRDRVERVPVGEWDGQGDPPLSSRCLGALEAFLVAKGNTSPSVATTFGAPLGLWLQPTVDAATAGCDFSVASLRREPMSVYICINPDRLAEARVLLNLLWSRIIGANTDVELGRAGARHEVLLLMDEFMAIGYLPIVDRSAGYLRSYGLRLLTVFQSEGQIQGEPPRGYGVKGARTLITCHAARVIYTPRVQQDAEEYSRALGFETVTARSSTRVRGSLYRQHTESDQRRALMLEQELREMPEDEQIVMLEGVRPIRCRRPRYFEHEEFMGRLRPISPTLAAIGRRPPTKEEIDVVRELGELAVHVPAIDLDAHEARAYRHVREMRAADREGGVDLERVAVSFEGAPVLGAGASEEAREAVVRAFWAPIDQANAADRLDEDLAARAPEVPGESEALEADEGSEGVLIDLAALRAAEPVSERG